MNCLIANDCLDDSLSTILMTVLLQMTVLMTVLFSCRDITEEFDGGVDKMVLADSLATFVKASAEKASAE